MTVTIYGTTNCAFCKVEKEWLDSKSVEYKYHNIDEDESAKEYVKTLGFSSFPVTIVFDEKPTIIQGFNRPALSTAIGI